MSTNQAHFEVHHNENTQEEQSKHGQKKALNEKICHKLLAESKEIEQNLLFIRNIEDQDEGLNGYQDIKPLYPKLDEVKKLTEDLPTTYKEVMKQAAIPCPTPSAPPLIEDDAQKSIIKSKASKLQRSQSLNFIDQSKAKTTIQKKDDMHHQNAGILSVYNVFNAEILNNSKEKPITQKTKTQTIRDYSEMQDQRYFEIKKDLTYSSDLKSKKKILMQNTQNDATKIALQKKQNKIQAKTHFKALAIFITAFAIAEFLQRSGRNHPISLSIAAIFASLAYMLCYGFYLANLSKSVEQDKEHGGFKSGHAALLMPVILGVMIAPIYFRFEKKEIMGAMAATLCVFAFAAIYGKATDKDLGKMENTIAVAGLSLIAVSLVNVFIFKSSVLEVAISAAFVIFHAFFICKSAQDINKQTEKSNKQDEAQIENLNAMSIANSLVGVTLELLNIKEQIAK